MEKIIHYLQLLIFITLFFPISASYADVVVPDVMNLKIDDAQRTLRRSGLSNISVKTQRTNLPVDTIIVQAPPAGTRVSSRYPVSLIVAISLVKQKRTKVPNLKGLSLSQAKSAIKAASLAVGTIKKRKIKMDDIEVIYQSPKAGKGLQVNSRVDFIVSDPIKIAGARVKVVLDKTKFFVGETTVIRATVSNADTSRKVEYGFSINGRTRYSSTPSYQYTFPKAGRYIITASFRYARGSWSASLSKTVRASNSINTNAPKTEEKPVKKKEVKKAESKTDKQEKEDRYVDTPNVVGLSKKAAISAIKRRGLRVGRISEKEDESGKIRILRQSPKAGKRVKKGSKVSITKSIPVEKVWQKPKAIIFPATVTVTQGERATFYSQSSQDESSRLSLQWSSKQKASSTRKKFRLKTQKLKAGKYWIKLIVKDNKKHSDGATALLIVNENQSTIEKSDEGNISKNTAVESQITNQVTSQENVQGDDKTVVSETKGQAPTSLKKVPLDELPKENESTKLQTKNTTDSEKAASLSETTTQSPAVSSKIPRDKVITQRAENQTKPIKQNKPDELKPSLTADNSQNSSKSLFNKNSLPFSWKIWVWLLLTLFIIIALFLVLWSHRKRHKSSRLVVDFHLEDDDGKQEMLDVNTSAETSLNSIHFSSQVDNGEQDVRLKDKD